MIYKAVPVAVSLLLCGCATYRWQKDGATQEEFNRDRYQCMTEAAQTYPTTVVPMQLTSGYTTPAQTYCNGNTDIYGTGYGSAYGTTQMNCTTTPGQQVAPVMMPVDVNANNRAQAAKSCMYARGYQLVRVK